MNKFLSKNLFYVLIIIAVTAVTIFILASLPNYAKPVQPQNLDFKLNFVIAFILFNLIFIGISAGLHKIYTKDYSKIKSVLFFVLFGGITGAMLGEGGNLIMIIPYSILMLIYALAYKKFTWWKVALTSYLGGIIVENVINHSPLQSPTLMWIAFFTYPYFVTKIWDNRGEISLRKIIVDFKWSFVAAPIFVILAILISRDNISPPLIIFGATLPFVISIISKLLKTRQ